MNHLLIIPQKETYIEKISVAVIFYFSSHI